jgi:hypothetical protein
MGCCRYWIAEAIKSGEIMKRQFMLYVFQATALFWAIAVCLRTVDLGWNPFAGIGLGMFGALPISFLGIRIHSKHDQAQEQIPAS